MSIRKMLAPALFLVPFALHGVPVAGEGGFRLPGHAPHRWIHRAHYLGPKESRDTMQLAVVLQPHSTELEDFLHHLRDPQDPQYGHFLTPAQFAERFAPTDAEIQQLTDHLARSGLRVRQVHANHLVVDVEGSTAAVQDAFQVTIGNYQIDGRVAHAADADPKLPAEIAMKVHSIAGLHGFVRQRKHMAGLRPLAVAPNLTPLDLMTPAKVRNAYSLPSSYGTGETLALFELDGYSAADVSAYASAFSLTSPTLQNVLVSGASGAAGADAAEVTLDIELAASVAPSLAKILVYEGPNTDQGVLDTYSKIATDNLAPVVSTSWGAAEAENTGSFISAENVLFQQMAAQGQTVFAASGDRGAFDDPTHPNVPSVDDPASQPYVTAVGGTHLTLNTAGNYEGERAWSGSGGGVSQVWGLPTWQASVSTNANGESTSHRMVPDVSLDADPSTGYPIYFGGNWIEAGGTSCAAPIWAAFLSIVNQGRVANSLPRVGFLNSSLYQVAESSAYPLAFHDINDYSNNLGYQALYDYDLATGWGSFLGTGLYGYLTAATVPAALSPPSVPSAVQLQVLK